LASSSPSFFPTWLPEPEVFPWSPSRRNFHLATPKSRTRSPYTIFSSGRFSRPSPPVGSPVTAFFLSKRVVFSPPADAFSYGEPLEAFFFFFSKLTLTVPPLPAPPSPSFPSIQTVSYFRPRHPFSTRDYPSSRVFRSAFISASGTLFSSAIGCVLLGVEN